MPAKLLSKRYYQRTASFIISLDIPLVQIWQIQSSRLYCPFQQLTQSHQTSPSIAHIALLVFQVPCRPQFCSLTMSRNTQNIWYSIILVFPIQDNNKTEIEVHTVWINQCTLLCSVTQSLHLINKPQSKICHG